MENYTFTSLEKLRCMNAVLVGLKLQVNQLEQLLREARLNTIYNAGKE
jgi:hypothetical protein